MSREIWKSEIEPGVREHHCGPILHVDVDWRDKPCMWVEHDPETDIDRTIQTIPTGSYIPEGAVHRGTFILRAEGLVFHVYELAPVAALSREDPPK